MILLTVRDQFDLFDISMIKCTMSSFCDCGFYSQMEWTWAWEISCSFCWTCKMNKWIPSWCLLFDIAIFHWKLSEFKHSPLKAPQIFILHGVFTEEMDYLEGSSLRINTVLSMTWCLSCKCLGGSTGLWQSLANCWPRARKVNIWSLPFFQVLAQTEMFHLTFMLSG